MLRLRLVLRRQQSSKQPALAVLALQLFNYSATALCASLMCGYASELAAVPSDPTCRATASGDALLRLVLFQYLKVFRPGRETSETGDAAQMAAFHVSPS